jgi:hypothetical protein
MLLGLALFIVPLLVRRAKLGSTRWRRNPAPKALVRHRVLSVASASATMTAKRTQGDDGLQCESVKGLSLVMNKRTVDADLVSNGEGNTKEAKYQCFQGSTGVLDRSTSSR